jgi:hypothetical protein
VVAFGTRGVADVTLRYTANYAGALARRTLISEAYLQVSLFLGCEPAWIMDFERGASWCCGRAHTSLPSRGMPRPALDELMKLRAVQTAVNSLNSRLRGGLPEAEARQTEAADAAEAAQLAAGEASISSGPLPGQLEVCMHPTKPYIPTAMYQGISMHCLWTAECGGSG